MSETCTGFGALGGVAESEKVANGHPEGVGGVGAEWFGKGSAYATRHGCHLLFAAVASAGKGLFDFAGSIFCHGHALAHGGGNNNALSAPQFEHALNVFAEKGGFYGQFLGPVLKELVQDELMNVAQTFKMAAFGVQGEVTYIVYLHYFFPLNLHYGKA